MNDCIFCKIAKGEIPSNTVYENDSFRVILDINPANEGHCLIIPKKHGKDIFELDNETVKSAFGLAKKVSEAVKVAFNSEGLNIVQNNGELAGQTVDHFHIHVIPRKKDDNVNISSQAIKLTEEKFKEIKEKIQKYI